MTTEEETILRMKWAGFAASRVATGLVALATVPVLYFLLASDFPQIAVVEDILTLGKAAVATCMVLSLLGGAWLSVAHFCWQIQRQAEKNKREISERKKEIRP